MEKIKIIFYGSDCNPDSSMTAMCTNENEITLQIKDIHSKAGMPSKSMIRLDRATAIKLVKVLRVEISKTQLRNG